MGDLRMNSDSKKVVFVTGFGPFGGHPVNASWEAVKELTKLGLPSNDYLLVTKEVPVTYRAVKNEVPKLWEELQPHLVVHVGVSHLAQELTLERVAHNKGYERIDAEQKTYDPNLPCCDGGPCKLQSKLKLDIVCDKVNRNPCDVMAVTSTDAGRYLCEFIYYTSLNQDCERAAFIHVPPLEKPYTSSQLAHGLQVAIMGMLEQLEQ